MSYKTNIFARIFLVVPMVLVAMSAYQAHAQIPAAADASNGGSAIPAAANSSNGGTLATIPEVATASNGGTTTSTPDVAPASNGGTTASTPDVAPASNGGSNQGSPVVSGGPASPINQGSPVVSGGPGTGGNGPIVGSTGGGPIAPVATSTPIATSTPVVTECKPYLVQYLGTPFTNSQEQVSKLQNFLKIELGLPLVTTGVYDAPTIAAVKAFQIKYTGDILRPWNATVPSGIVYISSLKKINAIACNKPFILSADELSLINSLKQNRTTDTGVSGVIPSTPNPTDITPSTPDSKNNIFGTNKTNQNSAASVILSIPSKIGNFFSNLVHFFTK